MTKLQGKKEKNMDVRGIIAFRETYPHLKIAPGIVIYAGDECYRIAENIIAVPWDLK